MAKFLKLLVAVPIALVIIAFAIANRQMVTVSFDPFSDPAASSAVITAPLFLLLLLVLLTGVFLGGVAGWFSQGKLRRRSRSARDDADRWREEAQRLRQQPPIIVPASRQLASRDI